jgi:hypothetical protein
MRGWYIHGSRNIETWNPSKVSLRLKKAKRGEGDGRGKV